MPALRDLAERIARDGLPVLLPDTSAVLDIVRAITREGDPNEIMAAIDVLAAALEDPPACQLVRASVVELEFSAHIQDTAAELERFITRQQSAIVRFNRIAEVGGLAQLLTPLDRGIVGFLEQKARDILTSSIPIDQEDNVRLRAADRVIYAVPPSRRGKDSYKDCLIFEEYIDLARQCRTVGGASPLVFITSNRDDFCTSKTDLAPHPHLKLEIEPVQLQFCVNWQYAHHLLHERVEDRPLVRLLGGFLLVEGFNDKQSQPLRQLRHDSELVVNRLLLAAFVFLALAGVEGVLVHTR